MKLTKLTKPSFDSKCIELLGDNGVLLIQEILFKELGFPQFTIDSDGSCDPQPEHSVLYRPMVKMVITLILLSEVFLELSELNQEISSVTFVSEFNRTKLLISLKKLGIAEDLVTQIDLGKAKKIQELQSQKKQLETILMSQITFESNLEDLVKQLTDGREVKTLLSIQEQILSDLWLLLSHHLLKVMYPTTQLKKLDGVFNSIRNYALEYVSKQKRSLKLNSLQNKLSKVRRSFLEMQYDVGYLSTSLSLNLIGEKNRKLTVRFFAKDSGVIGFFAMFLVDNKILLPERISSLEA